MPRKHGAAKVSKVIRRFAKAHRIPHSRVPTSVIRASTPTMPRYVPKVMPRTKVKAEYGELVEVLLKKLRSAGKKGGRTGKGTVVFTSNIRRRGRRRRKSSKRYNAES